MAKTSAGAVSYMPVARVANIPSLLKDLKKQGVWVFGTAAEGTTRLYDADLKGPAAIVIGSEGDGMSRLGGGELRLSGEHPHAGEDLFPERIGGGCHPAV